MTVSQLASPLELNVVAEGTEEDSWAAPVNENWTLIRQAVVDILADIGLKADLVGGKVPSEQLPQISAAQAEPVADQAAMLALSGATTGKLVIRADNGKFFALKQTPASTLANWIEIQTGIGVTSVNGETGVVTGYAKTSANSQTFTGTNPAFSNPLSVGTASANGHAVTKLQLDNAIAGVSPGSITKQTFLVGNGSATSFNIDHNRNSLAVLVQAFDVDSGEERGVLSTVSTVNRVVIVADEAPASNKLRIVVIG